MTLLRPNVARFAAAVVCALVLLAIGFGIGSAHGERTASPEIMRGTVAGVGGDRGQPPTEFVVNIDGSDGFGTSFGIGPVPWTDATTTLHESETPPPCIAVGRHITFGVAHVAHAGWSLDEVVWVDCSDV